MKHRHFETLKPICPVCLRSRDGELHALAIASIEQGDAETIFEGVLHCSNASCRCEYPIIDGLPLIVPDIRSFVAENIAHINARDDFGSVSESIIGDCCGPGSGFDVARQHLSSYAWDHYADQDPAEPREGVRPGVAVQLLERGLNEAQEAWTGPILDIGCSVGRSSFALAERFDELVLGIDLNYPMLRLAARVLRTGTVRYPRRRVGVVYDRREFPVQFANAQHVDFWVCDASALPFRPSSFGTCVGLNVLDCMPSPLQFLESVAGGLQPGGKLMLASPYDWSPNATPVEGWLGGHSQRGDLQGESDSFLRLLLTPGGHPQAIAGLEVIAELDRLPWHVRMHERSVVEYRVHLVIAKRQAS